MVELSPPITRRWISPPTSMSQRLSLTNSVHFYKDLFAKAYRRNGRNAVFVEYAWDLSSSNYTKCDPCATTPPAYSELIDAGVHWIDYEDVSGWGGADYAGDLFLLDYTSAMKIFTFLQTLNFMLRQTRQIIKGDMSCSICMKDL